MEYFGAAVLIRFLSVSVRVLYAICVYPFVRLWDLRNARRWSGEVPAVTERSEVKGLHALISEQLNDQEFRKLQGIRWFLVIPAAFLGLLAWLVVSQVLPWHGEAISIGGFDHYVLTKLYVDSALEPIFVLSFAALMAPLHRMPAVLVGIGIIFGLGIPFDLVLFLPHRDMPLEVSKTVYVLNIFGCLAAVGIRAFLDRRALAHNDEAQNQGG